MYTYRACNGHGKKNTGPKHAHGGNASDNRDLTSSGNLSPKAHAARSSLHNKKPQSGHQACNKYLINSMLMKGGKSA